MASNRKLQAEVDRVLKKIGEGLEIFDEIWEKLKSALNQSQKDKWESDLKKEIKKLQRLREQVKTWASSSEIRDKEPLLKGRRDVETRMERFKELEREMKTKAYSREGLSKNSKLSEEEQAAEDCKSWLADKIEEIKEQSEKAEADMEALSSTSKKKAKNADKIKALEERIGVYHWHIEKLELVIRAIDNNVVDVNDVNDIKEDIEYFIESNQEADFYNDMEVYDPLELEEKMAQAIVGVLPPQPAVPPAAPTKKEKKKSGDDDSEASSSTTTKKKEKKKKKDKEKDKEKEKEVDQLLLQQQQRQAILAQQNAAQKAKKEAQEQQRMLELQRQKEEEEKQKLETHTANPPIAVEEPPMPQGLPPPDTSGRLPQQQQPPSQPLSQGLPQGLPPPQQTSLPPAGKGEEAFPPQPPLQQQPQQQPQPQSQQQPGEPQPQRKSPRFTMPALDNRQRLSLLDSSLLHCPQPVDSERPKTYYPKQPFTTPSSFPSNPPPMFETPAVFERMDPDTLFLIFFYQQGTYQQYLASRELKRQSWRFHKKYRTWFQRHQDPTTSTDEYEVGTYVYFDYEAGWCQRIKTDFKFDYQFLE